MIILVATSIIVPVNLAFSSPDDLEWSIFFYTIDGIFAVDLIVWFFTSYQNDKKQEVLSHKLIAINYLKTWFFIDLISIIPFDSILSSLNLNSIFSFTRMS